MVVDPGIPSIGFSFNREFGSECVVQRPTAVEFIVHHHRGRLDVLVLFSLAQYVTGFVRLLSIVNFGFTL
jgi:hypothetical protein